MKRWELGYIAAMVDAECHVGIQRQMGKNRRTPSYAIRFELAMIDRKPIDFINYLLPTAKVIHCLKKGRRSPYYRLRLVQKEALELLKKVLPYIQGKRRQIEICLEVDRLRRKYSPSRNHYGTPYFRRLPKEFSEEADLLFTEFRSLQLNKKPRKHDTKS